ncbi:MAG: DMT family transporter [Bacteroidales bacterium]|nr:DMT family transporter [Bacteroidales bacterium]MBN2819750.1 DMT family transporter [Bacteroidales bacterium]
MFETKLASHIKLHSIVFIYGFTAILGKLISISAVQLVWYRVMIAAVSFLIILKINRISLIVSRKEAIRLLSAGLIVAAHWITFFGAVKLSNVTVTLGTLATTAVFTGLIEPFYFKKKIDFVEILIGVITVIGLYLIFQFETRYWQGVVTALISAALAGWFTVINKKLVEVHRARVITFYEMVGGFIGISLFLLIGGNTEQILIIPTQTDIIYLLILGIVCTAFAFTIQVDVMKQLTAYIVSLTINLEPVYGIIFAYLIFGESEFMSMGFYIGTAIILITVFGYPVYDSYNRKKILG